MKREYFDKLAAAWDQLPGPPDAQVRVSRFLDVVGLHGVRRVLDAGAGTGILLGALRTRAPEAVVVEMDFAAAMLRESRRKHGPIRGGYLCGDATLVPLAKRSFDRVLCFNVLPHLGDPREAIRELSRLVAAGGRLAIGHMMPHLALNALHAQIGGAVANDRLPAPEAAAAILSSCGGRILAADEGPEHYCVLAEF